MTIWSELLYKKWIIQFEKWFLGSWIEDSPLYLAWIVQTIVRGQVLFHKNIFRKLKHCRNNCNEGNPYRINSIYLAQLKECSPDYLNRFYLLFRLLVISLTWLVLLVHVDNWMDPRCTLSQSAWTLLFSQLKMFPN